VAKELDERCQELEFHQKSECLEAAFIRLLIALQERADEQLAKEVDTLVEAKKRAFEVAGARTTSFPLLRRINMDSPHDVVAGPRMPLQVHVALEGTIKEAAAQLTKVESLYKLRKEKATKRLSERQTG
jgi:hypothetical protein